MKKLLLLLSFFTLSAFTMEHAKRKREETHPTEITYHGPCFYEKHDSFLIKAKKDKKTVGKIIFDLYPKDDSTACIYGFEVEREFRKYGIGYQLFRGTLLDLKRQNFARVRWTALGTDNIKTRQLEKIYLAMLGQLTQEIDFNLWVGKRQEAGIYETTVFVLTFK